MFTIQEAIESAWKSGFDPTGASQLSHKVKGTKKWIGTSEVAVLFSFFRLRIGVYEFKSSATKPHNIIQWITDYFHSNTSFLPPLYLQYAGHSLTLVGVELGSKGTTHILVFDPARSGQFIKKELSQAVLKSVRIPASRFNSPEYQIVTIKDETLMDSADWENSKLIKPDL